MGKKPSPPRAPASASFSTDEMAAMTATRARASASTPAAVREALLGQPITIGGVTLPVIMLGHVLLLQKIESPLATEGAGEPNNIQVCEALFVLNTPAAEVLALLRKPKEDWEQAIFEFAATKVPLADLPAIGAALTEQLTRAQSTVIGARSFSSDSPASSGEGTGPGVVCKKNDVRAPVTSPSVALPARPPNPTG
jgi:hypothetical protein